jgi:hypothetical protein
MPKRKAQTTRTKAKRGRTGASSSVVATTSAPRLTKQVSHYHGYLQFDDDDVSKLQEPLVGSWLHLKMYAVTLTGDKILNLDAAFPLKVSLTCEIETPEGTRVIEITENTQNESGLPALEVKGNHMTKAGTAAIQLKINALSRNFESNRFGLRVQPADDANVSGLKEVQTPTFNVVSQRLKVTDLGGENDGSIGVFYKDEGGKEKYLEYKVELKDARGLCTDRQVPLTVTLHYDTASRPEANKMTNNGKQELMNLEESQKLMVENGTGTVRLRVNDVSKNHYSNGFVVRIGPDLSGVNGLANRDVAAGWSGTTIVKSKKAKGIPVAQRTKKAALAAAALAAAAQLAGGSNSGSSGSSGSSGRSGSSGSSSSSSSTKKKKKVAKSASKKKPTAGSLGGSPILPVLPDGLQSDLQARIMVNPIDAMATLSAWEETLTNSLLQIQQHLQPFIRFSNEIALPLMTQVSFLCFLPFVVWLFGLLISTY